MLEFERETFHARIVLSTGEAADRPIEIRTSPITGRSCRITCSSAKVASATWSCRWSPGSAANVPPGCANDFTGFEVMLGDIATFSAPESTAEQERRFWPCSVA